MQYVLLRGGESRTAKLDRKHPVWVPAAHGLVQQDYDSRGRRLPTHSVTPWPQILEYGVRHEGGGKIRTSPGGF